MLFTEYELWPPEELDIFDIENVPDFIAKAAEADGSKYLNYNWQSLTAEMYTELGGQKYRDITKKRRQVLSAIALCEHLEKKGRFITDIINGIWAICEESTWSMPDGNGYLRDINNPKFDTHTAKTAQLLATCHNLFRKELPLAVKKRITYEVEKRCTHTFLESKIHTPEKTASALIACLFTESKEEKRRVITDRALELLDFFLEQFSSDSFKAKNELNLYTWSAYIFDILEILYCSTDNKLSVFGGEDIMKVAKTIYKSYLGNGGFSEKSTEKDGARIYLFGKRMDFKKLMDFGASEFVKEEDKLLSESSNLFHKLYSVKHAAEILTYGDNFDAEESGYIDSMDLFIKKTKDFSVAVKGGAAYAGNFMVYLENEPYVIDLEKSHNLPIINGYSQFTNTKKASCVKLENGIKIDLSETYPKDSGIISWVRTVEAEEDYVIVTEDYQLERCDEVKLILLMKNKPILSEDRIISGNARILWDGNLALRVELVKSKTYGYIYRLVFYIKSEEPSGTVRLAFKV